MAGKRSLHPALLAFRETREGSATPQIKLGIDWLGDSSPLNGLNTTYSLYAWAFGGAPTCLSDHKLAYGYNTSSTDTSADASAFLANISKPFFLSASLQHTLNGNGRTDGYSASASAYLKLTLDLIDPELPALMAAGATMLRSRSPLACCSWRVAWRLSGLARPALG